MIEEVLVKARDVEEGLGADAAVVDALAASRDGVCERGGKRKVYGILII